MRSSVDILKECFAEISKTEEVIRVDSIPNVDTDGYICVWKLISEVLVNERVETVEFFFAFCKSFPYTLPEIYFPNNQFGYIPHLDISTSKLCIAPDDSIYDISDCSSLLKQCIMSSLRLIEEGLKANAQAYVDEINSYWNIPEKMEPDVDVFWELHGSIPDKSLLLDAATYNKDIEINGKSHTANICVIFYGEEDNSTRNYINKLKNSYSTDVLFVSSFVLPLSPPYNMTFSRFLQCISDPDDIKLIKNYINKNKEGKLIFRLSETTFGGIVIKPVVGQRRGFRVSTVNSYYVLNHFEYKHMNLQRVYGKIFSPARICIRTSGNEMVEKKFGIAGLGSIGSNLSFFLSGWHNSQLMLIDDDILTIDNIGRHFLGYIHTKSSKVDALAKHFIDINPSRKVFPIKSNIQDVIYSQIDKLNTLDAIFICTGNLMSELCVIDNLLANNLNIPVFIIWVEPYCIAGHMLYINPKFCAKSLELFSPSGLKLYKYNLIADDEYKDYSKFTKRDSGCNSEYTNYSGNDIILFLSAIYPIINKLIEKPTNSNAYRWVGNTKLAETKDIKLKELPITDQVQIFKV